MSLVLFEKQDHIGRIILNNPEQLNAMNWEMAEAMEATVQKINLDPSIRVIIVQGRGKAFCAGGNLQFILDRTQKDAATNQQEMMTFYSKFLSIRHLKVPTIGMLQGAAVGAGFCLALCCDMRYATTNAKMGVNFAKLGLSSGMGGLFLLHRLVGPAVAADLLFTGRLVSGTEAQALGLANQICSAEELETKVLETAQTIASNAPLAVQIMKQGLQQTAWKSLEEIFDYESQGQAQCFSTQDLKEGIAAIQEKRAAQFRGI